MRLAQKIVKIAEFVTQDEAWRRPVERRGTKLINGEKVSCQDKLNCLQCGQPNVLILSRIIVNGPAVELVAVCIAAGEVFAKVPINGRKYSCPGISVMMTLIVDG